MGFRLVNSKVMIKVTHCLIKDHKEMEREGDRDAKT